MRPIARTALATVVALLVVTAAIGFAAETGMVSERDVNPVQEAAAVLCGGLCVAGAAGLASVAMGSSVVTGAVVGGAAYAAYEFGTRPTNASEIAGADATETEINAYRGAATVGQNNAILSDSLDNYLQDTEAVAIMEGKNAYIRALNNGTSEAAARATAHTAIEDYYAVKQKQLIARWETTINYTHTLRSQLESGGADTDLVYLDINITVDNGITVYGSDNFNHINETTLVNGSTVSYQTATVVSGDGTSNDTAILAIYPGFYEKFMFGDGPGTEPGEVNPQGGTYIVESLNVAPPTSSYDDVTYMEVQEIIRTWGEIQEQNQETQNRIDTFVNNTYSEYKAGLIDDSDLVDPYLGIRDYSPEAEFGSFAIRSFLGMGINPPENMSGVGNMTIVDNATGLERYGILMSDGVPEGGFELGEVYNPANLTGVQYLIEPGSGETHELTYNFSIANVTRPDGEPLDSDVIEYETIDYQTTNTSEFSDLLGTLDETIAEINARQQRLRPGSAGGGGLLAGISLPSLGLGLSTAQKIALMLLLALFAILLVSAV